MVLGSTSRVGLLSPAIDAHRLGISRVAGLLRDCGIFVSVAGREAREAVGNPLSAEGLGPLLQWLRAEGIEALGFSYRLDPDDAVRLFGRLVEGLRRAKAFEEQGGRLRSLFFAGLPVACALVAERYPFVSAFFSGSEEPERTLSLMGVPSAAIPASARFLSPYDEWRLDFGRELVAKADYFRVEAADRGGSPGFGHRGDSLAARVAYGRARGLPPLMRSHAGPYLADTREAVELFLRWAKELGHGGLLDILSIGTSQLSQSDFGGDWEGRSDGGGVPLRTRDEYERVWRAARPMLVRTYAGTRRVGEMARLYESAIDIAWHAFSFWWFSELDGRGPNGVMENIREHLAALRFVAASGKPFEPNVPHHFAFRGADDLSCVVAGYLAMRAAGQAGVGRLVLQTMLNTPRGTCGAQDIAKARTLLALARGIPGLEVYLQPRGGLDYFSKDELTAKAQLAAVTALMDDIEPQEESSPAIIHVVGYSEGTGLADPPVIEESIRITRHALSEYRGLKRKGLAPDAARDGEMASRAESLLRDAKILISSFEAAHPDPYGAEGLYDALASGLLVVPELAARREEFPAAAGGITRMIRGSMILVDEDGAPIKVEDRAGVASERIRSLRITRSGPRAPAAGGR